MIRRIPISLLLCLMLSGAISAAESHIQFGRLSTENSNLSHNYVRAIVKDTLGFVWIGTTNGLNRYDGHNVSVYYQGDNGLESSSITALCIDEENLLWVKSRTATQYYDYRTGRFVTAATSLFEEQERQKKNLTDHILGELMLGKQYPGLVPVCCSDDRQGSMWIGTNDGIYVFRHDDRSVEHLKSEKTMFSLSDNRVTAIYAGHEDELWVGTRSGVFYSDRISKCFFKITEAAGVSLENAYVNSLVSDARGRLWFSTENAGIFTYDIRTGEIARFRHKAIPQRCLNLRLFDNELWVVSESGVVRIDVEDSGYRNFTLTPSGQRLGYSRDVCRTPEGKVFAGTHVGLFMLDAESDEFLSVESLSSIYVESLFVDSKGRVWVATAHDGVICYYPESGASESYTFSSDVSGSLPVSRVLTSYEDVDGVMWFGTFGKGICRLDGQTGMFTVYNSTTLGNSGFNDICFSIMNDNSGNLWVGTSKGVVRLNPKTCAVSGFTTEDGLLDDVNVIAAKYHLSNDDMFYGTADGITVFNSRSLFEELDDIRLVFTDFYVNGKKVDCSDGSGILDCRIDMCRGLKLKSWQNSIELGIAVTGSKHSSCDIESRLVGHSDAWRPLSGTGNRLSYANVPYGKYVLEVREINSGAVRRLSVDIAVPVYLQWWAFVIYMLVAATMVFLVFRFIRLRDKKKNETILDEMKYRQEKELLEEKMLFLSNVVHEIKTPLTLIKSPLNAIRAAYKDDEQLHDNLKLIGDSADHLTQLSNELLEYLRLERKGYIMESSVVNIRETLRSICFNYEEKARASGIRFGYCQEDEPIWVEVDMSGFRKIVNNLLVNAFKYCDVFVSVEMRLSADASRCEMLFRNDGQKIPEEWRERIFKPFMRADGVKLNEVDGIGLGLPLARSLAQLNSGELYLNDKADITEFVLSFPCVSASDDDVLDSGMDKRFNILIAEDNLQLRQYLADQFSKEYKVFAVGDGLSAIRYMNRYNIDLLISDVAMPGMGGVELCRKVRETFDISHVMIIMISGINDLSMKISTIDNGANLYIEKPLDVAYLKACVRNLLEQRKILQKALCNTLTMDKEDNYHLNRYDREFVSKIESEIMANISNPAYSVTQLEDALCMSNATLLRKFKRLLNTTPNSYIRTKRLIMAGKMLIEGDLRISEVCFSCGFNSTTYFTKCFHDYYGCSPQAYQQNNRK